MNCWNPLDLMKNRRRVDFNKLPVWVRISGWQLCTECAWSSADAAWQPPLAREQGLGGWSPQSAVGTGRSALPAAKRAQRGPMLQQLTPSGPVAQRTQGIKDRVSERGLEQPHSMVRGMGSNLGSAPCLLCDLGR